MQTEKKTNLKLGINDSNKLDLKPVYDIKGLLQIIPIGRSTLYEEIKGGRLQHSKMGRRTLFQLNDVLAWLDSMRLPPNKEEESKRERF